MYATVHSRSSDLHERAFGCKGSTPFDVIVIAGSAHGIHAVSALLAALPEDFPAGIVVVQHLPSAARYRSTLDRVVQCATKLPVKWAEEGERIRPGVVFLAPQDRHLHSDRDHVLHLTDGPKINGFRPAADPLFTSVAAHFGARSIAVVLSGILSDGAQGAWNIAQQGGRVLVQDNVSAWFSDMPRAASQAAGADFTFSPVILGRVLVSLVMVAGVAEWFRVWRSFRAP